MNHDGPWTDPKPPTQHPGRGQSLYGGHAHVIPFVAAVGFSSDPIGAGSAVRATRAGRARFRRLGTLRSLRDRKSTRLNSSHVSISYAVFCLKKKTTIK